MAFGKGQVNPKLVEIGKEILGKCHGVPLAIKSIGSLLCLEKTEEKWSYVKDRELTNVLGQGDDIFPILKLSYDHLPSHLKSCFAYCSLLPKDYEMEKERLIQLWIAQRFIPSSNNDQQEEVANEYFKDLLWRSFFEEVNEYGVVKFKMHHLIHDLAELVAREECKLIDFDGKNVSEKLCHVSCPFYIGPYFHETLSLLLKAKKIRIFLQTSDKYMCGTLDESMLKTFIFSFKSLHELDLHGLMITKVPNSIGKLIHLKYLDLS